MDDFKRKIEEFFSGRHGSDQLSFAMSLAGLVLVVCSPAFENDDVHMLLSAVGLALIIWSVFRVLSRDDARRTKENEAFMSLFRRTPSPERRHKAELRRQEKEKKRRLKEKLKTHEMKRRYSRYYCGLCKAIEAAHGRTATKALSYDMTFLYILLADLYNQEGEVMKDHCTIHPVTKKEYISSPIASYVADMQVLLGWYLALDKWQDDGNRKARAFMDALDDDRAALEAKYPRQSDAIHVNLDLIRKCELAGEKDASIPAMHFSAMLAEVFTPYEDNWSFHLGQMGRCLGQFVYIMDAYDDMEKDRKKGSYNPFSSRERDDVLKNEVKDMLTLAASGAAQELEMLPLDENLSILRNVVYSGIWSRFEGKRSR